MIQNRVREYRKRAKISQVALAQRANVAEATIRRMERDPFHQWSSGSLNRIAVALEVDPLELLTTEVEGQEVPMITICE